MGPIETGRLVIRNFAGEDWPALKEIIVQYQSSAYAAYDHAWPTADEELRKITAWFAAGDDFLAACLKDTGGLIGYIALNKTAQAGQLSIGYCFNFDHHGKGYASEGCRAVIDHAFSALGAERLTAGTALANEPSRRLLERLGFRLIRQEVTSFRKGEDGQPIEFSGGVFELTRGDWLQS